MFTIVALDNNQIPEVEFVGMNHIGAFLFGKSVDYDPRTA